MKSAIITLVFLGGMAVAQGAAPVPLATLLDEAKAHNPDLLAASAAVKTATYGPAQAGALPDTEVMVQTFSVGDPRPFAGWDSSDFAYIGFGAAQEIPYTGKRKLRRDAAAKEIDVSRAESQMVLADVLLRVKIAYFGLARTQSVLTLLERSRGVVEQIEQAAQVRYRTGIGAQQDVLRAQLERSRLLNEIAMQQREAAQLQAGLRALLNRLSTAPEIIAEPLRPRAGDPFSADLIANNPDLQVQHARVTKADLDVKVAEREKKPDFGLQYMWQHTASNFRDYYMATFSIRLPNRKRVNAAIGEAEARRQQIEAAQTAQHRQLQGELEQELVMLRTIRDQLRIYREGLTPQSEAAFNTGMAAYRTGKQEYQALLASYSDTLRLGIEYQQLIGEHEITIARIERLTGGEVK
jgi:outer membrane protein, heavy metal efflux system